MDRRGFLGTLAALPIVAKFSQVSEKSLEEIAPNMSPEIVPGSGKITGLNYQAVQGSGTFIYPMCSG